MTKKSDHLEVVDTTGLTDADWAEINKSKNAYDVGGQKALSAALDDLAKDPSRTARVLGALFPDLVREATKDKMAPRGGLNFAREALLDCRREGDSALLGHPRGRVGFLGMRGRLHPLVLGCPTSTIRSTGAIERRKLALWRKA
jgi:hypothetical protein